MRAAPDKGPESSPRACHAFARFAWGALGYTIAVVLFGAVVRITGSGAGCGQHWPTCQGEIAHLPQRLETTIELTHRLTSGLALVVAIALPLAAWRVFPSGHIVRRAALASLALMVLEALLGAALVLFALVDRDSSLARAVMMPVHLANTSLLTAAMALTAYGATREVVLSRPRSPVEAWLLAGLAGMLLVSLTGAVTALGDTLYPMDTAADLTAKVLGDQAASAPLVRRVRALHPILAVLVAGGLLYVLGRVTASVPRFRVPAGSIGVLVAVQLAAGTLNVALFAPGWLQVVHLGLAAAIWVALVLLWAAVTSEARSLKAAVLPLSSPP